MLTQQTLRRLATDKVFARGQDLFDQGAVTKLSRAAPMRFAARVKGTYRYSVQLWLASGEAVFSCDCPYDLEGICKHAVALGLAVLDTYGNSLGQLPLDGTGLGSAAGAGSAGNVAATGPTAALPEAVAAAWGARPEAERLRFLELALAKNDDLARQFLAFGLPDLPRVKPGKKAKGDSSAFPPDPTKHLAERLRDTLGALEFGEDFFESNPDHYESEDLSESGYEIVREELQPFADELLTLARGGELTQALRYWTKAGVAIYGVEEPASDDYGTFGDYGPEALEQWQALLAEASWPRLLTAAVLPAHEVTVAFAYLTHHLRDPQAARWADDETDWQALLEALADEPVAAPLLPPLLSGAWLPPATLARLRLRLARAASDDTAWVAQAETLLTEDADVARQLLGHYTQRLDWAGFGRAATTAFATWPEQFADFTVQNFAPERAPAAFAGSADLYFAALRFRALANRSTADFGRLLPLLNAADRAAFEGEVLKLARGGRGGLAFASHVLAATDPAHPAALRTLLFSLEWPFVSPPAELETVLARLAALDPTALILEMETRLPAYLNGRAGAKRGAALYERIAMWLTSAQAATPRLTDPVRRLAQRLREEFPTLHGLREVLQRQRLLVAKELGEVVTTVPKQARGQKKR